MVFDQIDEGLLEFVLCLANIDQLLFIELIVILQMEDLL